ncbi:Wzz/FepE/Etk N-terminal domain-containing protein [Pedobacter sp. Leaf194]|uniref:Wzz/FepE/Etk N-terminal domain-containing protein n=1 Tax=Pedobacter sp. Leaf194 TaxID=1736297 RepID=UPI00070318D8|nr:Wzz/FepE/Etk N-terminal domain-containing protein [Pedobacter sp. Leaf194]KQS37788.1 lipopolysaccharide biosynthesis protein [Pedobacter sp. Leaf194]
MARESQGNIVNDNDEVSVREIIVKIIDWWRYLLSKWLIILACGALGGALGFTYAYFKKPVYTATTTFVLEDQKSTGLGSLAGLASIAGVDIGGAGGGLFQGENILSLYKSRAMLQKTLLTPIEINGKKLLLIDLYIDINKLREKWKAKPELVNLEFSSNEGIQSKRLVNSLRIQDSILGVVVTDINRSYLQVTKPDKKLSTIEVDVKATDEAFAKKLNDELVKNVNQFYLNTKTKKTLQNVNILQHKTDSVRAVMNGAIYSAAAVADATPNLNPTRQVQRIAPVQRSQFSAETNKAILSSLVQNLEMSKLSLMKEMPLLEIIDRPIYPLSVEKTSKFYGVIMGGFILGFLAILFFSIKRYLEIVIKD